MSFESVCSETNLNNHALCSATLAYHARHITMQYTAKRPFFCADKALAEGPLSNRY
ncbi:hypothetical protein Plhal710r2_c005g0021551 [Plasmopara halstedii]